MGIESQEFVYCAVDDEYRVCCEISDELCKESYYENHSKSRSHINSFIKDND